MIINYKHLTSYAHSPVKVYKEDACFDLRASKHITIPSKGFEVVNTEIAIRVPSCHVGFILSRSGLAAKKGIFVLNAPGVIDAGYTGEIKIVIGNLGDDYFIERGDKVAQFMVMPIALSKMLRADNMVWDGFRGDKGFGSTGY